MPPPSQSLRHSSATFAALQSALCITHRQTCPLFIHSSSRATSRSSPRQIPRVECEAVLHRGTELLEVSHYQEDGLERGIEDGGRALTRKTSRSSQVRHARETGTRRSACAYRTTLNYNIGRQIQERTNDPQFVFWQKLVLLFIERSRPRCSGRGDSEGWWCVTEKSGEPLGTDEAMRT